MYKTELLSDNKGLRITFVDLRLNHSGIYICSASNIFETVQKAVNLIVWPNGMLGNVLIIYLTVKYFIMLQSLHS